MKKQKIISVIPERFNREPSDFKRRWVPAFAGMTCLIIAAIFAINALADFTVGKPMYEAFQMFNADGTARTNCDLTKFTTKTWINDTPVAMTWTFRNQSTGDYDATGIPSATGDVKIFISYSGTAVGTFSDNVRLWDIDTMYGNAGPRMANESTATARNAAAINSVPANVWASGTRTLTTSAYVNVTGINNYLTAQHGTGLWNAAANIQILPFQGAATYETVAQGNDVHVTYGDSVSIPYSIGQNITGYTVWFGAKANTTDATYAIAPRDITAYVTNASTGAGLINLSTTDTALPVRKYAAQVEIKNGSTVNTVLKFNLWIDASVLN